MRVFLRLGGCLEPGGPAERVLLTRTRWYCLPVKVGAGGRAGGRAARAETRVPLTRVPPQAPVTLREEADEGVIYTVASRPPGGAAGPGTPAGQSRVLKAGSLPRLARHLLEAAALGDACYVPAFLATYRTFAAPHVVLGLLLDRCALCSDRLQGQPHVECVTEVKAGSPVPRTQDARCRLATLTGPLWDTAAAGWNGRSGG
uniref:N-terminal Ras-GEF domain-containing protein n=1 Tax=Varanus komodoensis TaxID=61221 RepID=A0A8D2KRZ8_VARKO